MLVPSLEGWWPLLGKSWIRPCLVSPNSENNVRKHVKSVNTVKANWLNYGKRAKKLPRPVTTNSTPVSFGRIL